MKKILLLNFQIIISGIITGISMALSSHSAWWLTLCIIPVFVGWVPIIALINKMDDHLEDVSTVVYTEFFLSITGLTLGPLYLDEKSFIGIAGITTLFFITIISMALLFKMRNKWIIKAYESWDSKSSCIL